MITQDNKSQDANYLRRFVTRVTNLGRTARLRRQFDEIERRSLELPRSYRTQLAELIHRECANVEESSDPRMYGSHADGDSTVSGLDTGYDRARSDNVQVRMRGLALWLALVYNETRGSEATETESLYRHVLHLMRELKVFATPTTPDDKQT